MRIHHEDFEPFVVDQPFGSFLRSMSKDGTYGGNECIVACSRLFDAKICIHQVIIQKQDSLYPQRIIRFRQINQYGQYVSPSHLNMKFIFSIIIMNIIHPYEN